MRTVGRLLVLVILLGLMVVVVGVLEASAEELDDPVSVEEDPWFSCVVITADQDFRTVHERYWACVFPDGMHLVGDGDETDDWTVSGPRSDQRCTLPDSAGSCTSSGQYSIFDWNDWDVLEQGPGASDWEWVRGSATWPGFDPSGSEDYLSPDHLTWRPNTSGVCSSEASFLSITSAPGGGLVWLPVTIEGDGDYCRPGYLRFASSGTWPADFFTSSGDPTYTAPPATPTITVDVASGSEDDSSMRTFTLDAPDHDGEDVTCWVQGASPSTGTVASGEFTFTWTPSGFGEWLVFCEPDDGAFDGTDDGTGSEVDFVAIQYTIGFSIGDAVSGDEEGGCGLTLNVGCYFKAALRWAFVPSEDVVSSFLETASEQFPFSVGAAFIDVLTTIKGEYDDATAGGAGVTFEVDLGWGAVDVGFQFPCVFEPGVDEPCSPGSVLVVDEEGVGSWLIPGDTSGGVSELWGLREVLRSVVLIGLYVGWAFGLFKWAERKLEGGSAG